MKFWIRLAHLVVCLFVLSCRKQPPTKSEIIKELRSQGHKVDDLIDAEPFENVEAAEKLLAEKLRSLVGRNTNFEYRRLQIFQETDSLVMGVFELDRYRTDVADAVEEVLKGSGLKRVVLTNELIVDEGGRPSVVCEGLEFTFQDGVLTKKEVGSVERGLHSDIKK